MTISAGLGLAHFPFSSGRAFGAGWISVRAAASIQFGNPIAW